MDETIEQDNSLCQDIKGGKDSISQTGGADTYHASEQELSVSSAAVYSKARNKKSSFFGVVEKYATLAEASSAARAQGLTNSTLYQNRYKEDARLPAAPHLKYAHEWRGWPAFLGNALPAEKYSTLAEASAAARKLGFASSMEYMCGYKKDPRLPAAPYQQYPDEWIDWYIFLGLVKPQEKYCFLAEASAAACALGFKDGTEYKVRYKIDPRLPANPDIYYSDAWKGWHTFLGRDIPVKKYSSLAEASAAARRLGISRSLEYSKAYRQDPRLPPKPAQHYKDEWENWYSFLGNPVLNDKYPTLEEARAVVCKLGILNSSSYREVYKSDSRLPASPDQHYVSEWRGWEWFLLPTEYRSLSDLKRAVRVLRISNSRDYKEKQKLYPPLPSHPERMFKDAWVDWYDLCDISRPYSYLEASSIAVANGLRSQAAYLKYISESGDARLPRNPDQVYKEGWVNWHVFLGKPEPFTLAFIHEPYTAWRDSIKEFMRTARGGESKESYLCRFVRLYIQDNKLGDSPKEFLVRGDVDVRPFRRLLEQLASDVVRRSFLVAVNEFLEKIIRTELTIEDEDTGELVVVMGARNPLANLTVDVSEARSALSETCKPALAYQYVDAIRKWIISDKAKNFSDLKHLHLFDADWVDVDPKVIGKSDPDCVYSCEGGKVKLWCPIYWMHAFSLCSVPARGRQIAYNDSGEGDEWIPEIEGGRIVWKKNVSTLAGSTDKQGFVRHYPSDHFGMHFTTNKTSNRGQGYDVPWIPMELVYWIIKLRRWQEKYNPIARPTPWVECKRTKLNEMQRRAKGANCFLFRDFGEAEPGHFTARLSDRLAASLYYSQPKGMLLAQLNGDMRHLSYYVSKYTPHSMRVSLITAYVEEFGLPINVVMKIVGHSSIVMSIYYIKTNSENLRKRFSEGEKRALRNKAFAAQHMIEQGRIDEIKHELIASSAEALASLTGNLPAGSYLFRDCGFCPVAGSRCHDGGPLAGESTKVRLPTPNGYLGSQNCIRCRHFVTGPAFIGGLLSLGNEISLQANLQLNHYAQLEAKIGDIQAEIDHLDELEYISSRSGDEFQDGERNQLEVKLRKLRSEYEGSAKKLDLLMADFQAVTRLIKQCQALINQQVDELGDNKTQLIMQHGHELSLEIEETSYFHQLCEVCENAEIYESVSGEQAVIPRSQLLDKMISFNNLKPCMFMLDRQQQLVVGNQVVKLLMSRLKTWERVDDLVDGRIYLRDLGEHERISRGDLEALFTSSPKAIEN